MDTLPPVHMLRPSDPKHAEPERTHLPVPEFMNRLQVLTQLLCLKDQCKVVHVILAQGKGVKEQRLLRSVEREVAILLNGKTRIYSVRAGSLNDRATLLDIAGDLGLETQALDAWIASSAGKPLELDVSGVPLFVFNRKLPLSGAQPAEVLLDGMRKVLTIKASMELAL